MNKKQIENKVATSFNKATPNVFDQVRQDCNHAQNPVNQQSARKNPLRLWQFATFAMALVLVVGVILGSVGVYEQTASAASITLDVNPSVQIDVNKQGKVQRVVALNQDGEVIVDGMDFEGAQLKLAVNALVGAMLRLGYLNEYANSVLVSVDSNQVDFATLANLIAQQIDVTVTDDSGKQLKPSVVTQHINKQSIDEAKQIAQQYDVSVGKAQLVNKIVKLNGLYSVEQLVTLSVNELNHILKSNTTENALGEGISSSGNASEKNYVGKEKALQIALERAGLSQVAVEQLTNCHVKLDFDDHRMVYEVEFYYDGYKYEMEIDAIKGVVVEYEKEAQRGKPSSNQSLTKEQIAQAVRDYANLSQDVKITVEYDADDKEYEAEYVVDGCKYEIKVDCQGNVVGQKVVDTQAKQAGNQKITAEQAVEIALARAGLTRQEARNLQCEQDGKNVVFWEVEFECNGYEYECKINANTGSIVKWDKEWDD